MDNKYEPASEEVVALVNEVIEDHHPELAEAKIGILMRDVAPKSGTHRVLGKTKKVSDEQRAYIDYDFIIWFAFDVWKQLTLFQRRALVDHELCHCWYMGENSVRIRKHDFEEFNEIIERYGFWWPDNQPTEQAFQARFGFEQALRPNAGAQPADVDVLDQVGGLLDDE